MATSMSPDDNATTSAQRRKSVLVIFCAVILLAAALLKWHQLVTVPNGSAFLFHSPAIATLFVVFELILSALLISGLFQRQVIGVSILLFSVFFVFQVWRLFSGHRTCGCFGQLEIRPEVSILLDLVVIGSLYNGRSSKLTLFFPRTLLTFTAAICVCLVLSTISYRNRVASAVSVNVATEAEEQVVLITQSELAGKTFDLAKLIDGRAPVLSGKWRVIFYHDRCEKCKEMLRKEINSEPQGENVAFVLVPPTKDIERNTPQPIGFHWLRLRDGIDWFVETPLEIHIIDGVVQ